MSQQPVAADPVEWGHGWHARFDGMPPSKVWLCPDYGCVKYKCQVCGRQHKSIMETTYFYCKKCPYKICEDCVLYRPVWRTHVCPPARP